MTVHFVVGCKASYRSSMEIPDDVCALGEDEMLFYINDNLSDANIESEFEWLEDDPQGIMFDDVVEFRR